MRYHWNHHSYNVNIAFLNNLGQKQIFFIFCIIVFSRYKGLPAGKGLSWPRVQLQILISWVVEHLCKSSALKLINEAG